jgi:uncharacterized protein (TIGR00251 family)
VTDAEDLSLGETARGTWLKVRAVPGASRERIVGILGDALKVAVSAAPEKGKANKRVLAVLAAGLGLAPNDLRIVSGQTARDKRVLVLGLSTTDLRDRLRKALPPGV